MTPPIHMGLAQHPIKTGRGRGLSQISLVEMMKNVSPRTKAKTSRRKMARKIRVSERKF